MLLTLVASYHFFQSWARGRSAREPWPQLCGCGAQLDPGDPRRAGLPSWECELQGGEALYIPRRWWHEITATSASLSVSYWWT